MMFDPAKCIGCGTCLRVCRPGALSGLDRWDRQQCTGCRRCAELCPADARRLMGREYSEEELVRIVMEDWAFFERSGGGVTFSGGEPLMQADFVEAVSRRLKARGIDLAVETCGDAPWEDARRVFEQMDSILFDIKHMDSAAHRRLTGAGNERILENAARAAEMGKRMVIRVPVIGGMNGDRENISATGRFAGAHGIGQVHLLPYHRLGENKYGKLGRGYEARSAFTPPRAELEQLARMLEDMGLTVRIGG